MGQILDEMPPDPTDREDMVFSALFLGRPAEVLASAEQVDIWLAAHLADLMEPIELIDAEADEYAVFANSHLFSLMKALQFRLLIAPALSPHLCRIPPVGPWPLANCSRVYVFLWENRPGHGRRSPCPRSAPASEAVGTRRDDPGRELTS